MNQKKVKIGARVKILKCIDPSIPYYNIRAGDTGMIWDINCDRPAPISVKIDRNGVVDGFWKGELEAI